MLNCKKISQFLPARLLTLYSSSEGDRKMSAREFPSFFSFLMEPMANLEPERSSEPASSNVQLQNMPQDFGELPK